jgi:hypothetical protein
MHQYSRSLKHFEENDARMVRFYLAKDRGFLPIVLFLVLQEAFALVNFLIPQLWESLKAISRSNLAVWNSSFESL